ncbi:tRNA pseudouridine synthase B [Oceaniovalibus guishaninsula JLT2003]|uniref:tRNA pseudouridine synthase B n=1 Tax=Oceaniovalibus guishaninsula JLT2003 TaxID=1231392 RepID=K2I5N7_9RHOB|nr:tRNA pseudouridine(55) synthase TruB [Oceaniovalibus guishaninsula]EKE44250.1 tRNA pseudouridine synthase B [Oceaniovalibus guishaninsula JLT2003]
MGRRKGRDLSGWLIVDKPAGPTSTDVVNKVRWALEARKAGHAGTLDPAATGLLAVALGEATKVIPYVTDALKCYEFTVRWGAATDTDDAEGAVIETSGRRPDAPGIAAALPALTGDIRQVPPQYSAVRIAGERAYDMAREGRAADIAARDLHVAELALLGCDGPDLARLRMVCGKGGYVRAIARDLGRMMGCLGHVQSLRRVWSGPFDLDRAVTLDTVQAEARTDALDARLLPVEAGLAKLGRVTVTAPAAERLRNGNPAEVLTSEVDYGDTAWASAQGRAVAIGAYRAGVLHPARVLLHR